MTSSLLSRFSIAATLTLAALASAAHADPAIGERVPPLAPTVRVDAGLGSPIGEIGVVYSRPLARRFGVELGAGLGFSGVQLSGMGKLRLGNGRFQFTPGLGLSVGLPAGGTGFSDGHPHGDPELAGSPVTMAWLDADLLSFEYRSARGLVVSVSAGATMALTHGHWDFIDLGEDVDPGSVAPQARIGLGWSL